MAEDTNKEIPWKDTYFPYRHVYTTLVAHGQLDKPFDAARDIRMTQLTFWNKSASDAMRQLLAAGLASQLDKVYVKGYWADYELGHDPHSAQDAMIKALTSADGTVYDLAKTIDQVYHFTDETEAGS